MILRYKATKVITYTPSELLLRNTLYRELLERTVINNFGWYGSLIDVINSTDFLTMHPTASPALNYLVQLEAVTVTEKECHNVVEFDSVFLAMLKQTYQHIDVIKYIRETLGCTLRQAKDLFDFVRKYEVNMKFDTTTIYSCTMPQDK